MPPNNPYNLTQVAHPVELTLSDSLHLHGDLNVPKNSQGLILFAHGSGSSRFSPRNQAVAHGLNQAGLATLLFDLLSSHEESKDRLSGEFRFDVKLLADRLAQATDWVNHQPKLQDFSIGYFGASTGAAAAIIAASYQPKNVKAVVSRGGRADMAIPWIGNLNVPTLLIVGSSDSMVLNYNHQAYNAMPTGVPKDLQIIEGAGHLFEEPGKLGQVTHLTQQWFLRYLQ